MNPPVVKLTTSDPVKRPSNHCSDDSATHSYGQDESSVKPSPVASRTRSKLSKEEPGTDVSDPCENPLARNSPRLLLKLPDSLTGVIKHHEDFVRCDNADVANAVKGLMQDQWASLVVPGQNVRVKFKDKIVSAVVERCHFISKLSFDCLYYFATAKVDLHLDDSDQLLRECQFRDLCF